MARIAQIVSTARYLPEHAVTNAELTERFSALGRPTVIDRLANSTGILRRFYAPDDWATSDIAAPAAKEALKRAGRKPENVDLIIVGTTSPDYITPDTSVVLQHKLGAKNAGIFDVGCACASFPALIAVASGLIATTAMKTILCVGVDMIHKLTDPSTTLADLFTLRARADPFSAVWASLRWRSGDERHDGVTDGRQAWSRRWSVDSFFPASLV
jgi:3-oxoacyl-[acyl-carrier-protein] synthase III